MSSQRFCVLDPEGESAANGGFPWVASSYVRWEAEQSGGALVDAPGQASILLVSLSSPDSVHLLRRTLKRLGITPDRIRRRCSPLVILGGQASMSPAVFDQIADVQCVGEGRTFLRTLVQGGFESASKLPCAWVPGETRPVYPDTDFPWDAPPVLAPDGVVRIFGSRACQKKCLFCQTGWQSTYQENDETRLLEQHRQLTAAGYKVAIVSNDAPALSMFGSVGGLAHFSASYSQTRELVRTPELAATFAGRTKVVRFGVEAPSTRLRSYVGKPIDTLELFEATRRILNAGTQVRWFMIAGLPGERDDDYEELREVVVRARHEINWGALHISFTAFVPSPAAPLCIAPIEDSYIERIDRFMDFVRYRRPTRRIAVFPGGRSAYRLRSAMANMAATEAELRRGWLHFDPPNWRVQYPLLRGMRRAYLAYASKVGLPC